MPEPRICVIVPAHNAEATLGLTLAALGAQSYAEPWELIVVDSASTDATAALAAADPRVRLLSNPGGEPAGSRNLGVAGARAPLLAFLDADCVPDPGWLEAGVAALGRADLVQGRVLPLRAPGPWDRTLSVGHESGLYETANLFVRRAVCVDFTPLPGTTPGTRPFGEDTWFAWRVRRGGARTTFCAGAVVRHAVFGGGPRAYVSEARRRGRFPALVSVVPELRDGFLVRRWFLSRGTAAFDLALLGVLIGVTRRRPGALVATAPYVRGLPRRPIPAAVQVAADAAGAAALVRGSLAARTLVL